MNNYRRILTEDLGVTGRMAQMAIHHMHRRVSAADPAEVGIQVLTEGIQNHLSGKGYDIPVNGDLDDARTDEVLSRVSGQGWRFLRWRDVLHDVLRAPAKRRSRAQIRGVDGYAPTGNFVEELFWSPMGIALGVGVAWYFLRGRR